TEANFAAFRQSDSLSKSSRGGKGIGRLLWLKAFEHAEIESTYRENGGTWTRSFAFSLAKGIDGGSSPQKLGNPRPPVTIVRLVGLNSSHREYCPKTLEVIARKIAEHCLAMIVLGRCPTIVVHDDNGDSVVLQELFKRELQEQATNKTVKIKDVKFLIHHLRLARTADQTHRLHICACRRVVVSVPLAGKIPDLTKSLTDDKGQPFVYVGYLTGEHLDTSVNPERTAFDIE